LGPSVVESTWWGRYANLGEVLDVHQITTKKGDPMAFVTVSTSDGMKEITVFPNLWAQYRLKEGDVGIFAVDERGILKRYTSNMKEFKVEVKERIELSVQKDPNVFYKGVSIGHVDMTDENLRALESVGIVRIW